MLSEERDHPENGRNAPAVTNEHTLTATDYANLLEFRTSLRKFMHWSETRAREAGLTPAQHQLMLAVKGHSGAQG